MGEQSGTNILGDAVFAGIFAMIMVYVLMWAGFEDKAAFVLAVLFTMIWSRR